MDVWIALGLMIAGSLAPPLVGLWLRPALTRAILGDLRFPRILYFLTLGSLGMAIRIHETGQTAMVDWAESGLEFLAMLITLSYAAVFAIVTNNLEDLDADRISNPDRPLVRGSVNKRSYLLAGVLSQALALGFALVFPLLWQSGLQLDLFWGILGISVGYYVYSCRPLRLKRVPILAKLIIGMNGWMVTVCGYTLAGGEWATFPWIWSIFILGPLSLAANFIDLKDIAGDKATGVATLPVLLGERNARLLIALATLATYVMGGILLDVAWAYPLNAGAALLHIYLLYRKPYNEKLIFPLLLASLAGLVIFLVWA
ncbi:MAG: UbiA prenyltransferase family protein [Bacteroidetes bacterium]|nr:UbiA prenyltransferase family protein [Bacteroidota bacterium]